MLPINFRDHHFGLFGKVFRNPIAIITFMCQIQLVIERGGQRLHHLVRAITRQCRALLLHGFCQIGQ
ncbi:hypothetical protein D3C76_1820710 [compost metagenome]